uniref:Uncharacterized protein n=1 Tax=Timema poppense TaxID=170557 RepID=A0A7R9HCL8_TIMPO|nr:unnamed protein product [Timema poppensis]
MDSKPFFVKIEPGEEFKYDFHHEEKLEVKSEIDVPTQSEGFFNEEVNDYQQPQCLLGNLTPPIKDELPKHQENSSNEEGCSKWSVSVGKCIKHGATKPKCKEGCIQNDKGGGFQYKLFPKLFQNALKLYLRV